MSSAIVWIFWFDPLSEKFRVISGISSQNAIWEHLSYKDFALLSYA